MRKALHLMAKIGRGAQPAAAAAALAAAGCAGARPTGLQASGLTYPETRRGDVVETLHGAQVADPYRWLEDLDSAETADWVARQNVVTDAYLAQIPERAAIRARLERLFDHERFGVPFREGGRTFYRRNDGLENQSVLYVVDADGAEPRVLLDPNTLSADGTVALDEISVSRDGRLLAYALSSAGSDWKEWHVRDVATGADLPDVVTWSKFSGASWDAAGTGFWYSAYDAPAAGKTYEGANYFQKVRFHRLGTPPSSDAVVFEDRENKERGFGADLTDDGRFLILGVWEGSATRNRLYYRRSGEQAFVRLFDAFDARYEFLGNLGDTFLVWTDNGAPRGRVIAVDLAQPDPSHWREVVPESADRLDGVHLVGGRLVCSYLHDAYSVVRVVEADGRHAYDVELPGIGTADGFNGKPGDGVSYFSYTSFTTPAEIRCLDVATGAVTLFRRPEVPIDPERFVTRQVFVTSKDGTRVPMFVSHRRDVVPDGATPTYLYGYGGFDISLTPGFSTSRLVWMEMGGVYAVANLRGGGEYGEEWHAAGTKERKQNVFDDFVACAEWLIAEGVTDTRHLAIGGGSNGGLLVGACMTQRPDLFAACVPAVGVLDMLRYHRFTIGWAWASDYGSADDADAFRYLYAYSPLHKLRAGTCYPATLVTTGDHDDRVVPSHSFKFAAELQRVQACDNPCLIRIETRAGHGAGKPTAKVIDEQADVWAFVLHVLGMPLPGDFGR